MAGAETAVGLPALKVDRDGVDAESIGELDAVGCTLEERMPIDCDEDV
jgi:hypothetical protein